MKERTLMSIKERFQAVKKDQWFIQFLWVFNEDEIKNHAKLLAEIY